MEEEKSSQGIFWEAGHGTHHRAAGPSGLQWPVSVGDRPLPAAWVGSQAWILPSCRIREAHTSAYSCDLAGPQHLFQKPGRFLLPSCSELPRILLPTRGRPISSRGTNLLLTPPQPSVTHCSQAHLPLMARAHPHTLVSRDSAALGQPGPGHL